MLISARRQQKPLHYFITYSLLTYDDVTLRAGVPVWCQLTAHTAVGAGSISDATNLITMTTVNITTLFTVLTPTTSNTFWLNIKEKCIKITLKLVHTLRVI